jgi:hypothetical protein
MIGVSEETFELVKDVSFLRSKGIKEKINLKKIIIKDKCYENLIKINRAWIIFRMKKTFEHRSIFLNINISKSILEWFIMFLIFFCFVF